ncbi:MAG: hypothetical protein AAGG65_21180 [Pseudomonadota bacterium]
MITTAIARAMTAMTLPATGDRLARSLYMLQTDRMPVPDVTGGAATPGRERGLLADALL